MLALLAAAVMISASPGRTPPKGEGVERRCGWFDNITPGNFELRDRERQWTIARQGGYEAEGFERLPDMSGREWVSLGPHGYGCACLTGTFDRTTSRVRRVDRAVREPLRQCRRDRELPGE